MSRTGCPFIPGLGVRNRKNTHLEHYDQYDKAPSRDIEGIYDDKKKSLKPAIADGIRDILEGLSDEYEERKDKINPDYLYAQTLKYFGLKKVEILKTDLEIVLSKGDVNEAEQLIKDFKPLEGTSTSKINDFIYNIDEMMRLDIEKPDLLIKPWLREGQVNFIYGDYGTGKSLLAVHIAVLLALEDEDAGDLKIEEWQPKKPTGCLYVDGEMGVVELRERLSQFTYLGKQKYPVCGFPLPEYQLATEDDFFLSKRENQLQIIQWFKEHPDHKLLVLDSVTTLFGLTDENNNAEWSTKINPLLRDLKAMGVASILLHHSGKDSKRGLRGASAMGAMAHNIFCLTNHPEKDIDEGEAYFTLTTKKQRAGGFQFKAFDIHYSLDSGLTSTEWETNRYIKRNDADDLNDKQIMIIKKLVRGKLTQKEIAEKVGCNCSYITQVKSRAKKLSYLTPDGQPTDKWTEFMDEYINRSDEDEDDSLMGREGMFNMR